MSVVKRSNSKYWYIQFQMNGDTFIKSSKTTNKRAAEQMEIEWKSRLHAQNYLGKRPQITLEDAVQIFCDTKKGTAFHGGLISSAKVVCSILPARKKLDELSSHDLERLKRVRIEMGISPQTIRHNLNTIRGSIKVAKRLGYAVSEVEFPEIPVSRGRVRYLTIEEEKRLLTELDPNRVGRGLAPTTERDMATATSTQDAHDLVVLLLDTGARYSEIANIEWSCIDMEHREVRLWRSKVQNEAILYMTDRAYGILQRRKAASTGKWVFENRSGGPRGYAAKSIRKAFKRASLADCCIHTLRHTHASRLIQNGMSVYEVREVLGHTDIKTTMRYAHLEARQVTARARDVVNRLNSTIGADVRSGG